MVMRCFDEEVNDDFACNEWLKLAASCCCDCSSLQRDEPFLRQNLLSIGLALPAG